MPIIAYIQAAAEVKASEIVTLYPSVRADWEDIRQELMIHACRQVDKHNPRRGTIRTFISSVIDNKGKSILRSLSKNREDVCENIEVPENANGSSVTDIVEQQYWGVAKMIAAGYSRAEISNSLHISKGKIRKIILDIKNNMEC